MSGSEQITGDVDFSDAQAKDSGNGCAGRVGGAVNFGVDLSQEIGDCQDAAADLQPTSAGGTLTSGPLSSASGKLTGTQTITGVVGDNVICVKDVNVGGGQQITLTGPVGTQFVFAVTGDFKINGGKILTDTTECKDTGLGCPGNVNPADVIYNVTGTGGLTADGALRYPA